MEEKGIITDCKWKTYGCASAIASTSILSEKVIGMKIDEAYKVSPKDIAKELGGLPPIKMHCSLLAEEGLKSAVEDYRKKSKEQGQT